MGKDIHLNVRSRMYLNRSPKSKTKLRCIGRMSETWIRQIVLHFEREDSLSLQHSLDHALPASKIALRKTHSKPSRHPRFLVPEQTEMKAKADQLAKSLIQALRICSKFVAKVWW